MVADQADRRRQGPINVGDIAGCPNLCCRGANRYREPTLELPREIILQLHVNPNLSLGSGYRAYPGYYGETATLKPFGLRTLALSFVPAM
jgi:hypothetical protein